ncbi:nucleoside deaminase [soil metagenome]
MPVSRTDESHLRQAIAISARAVAHGNHPFGALLVDAAGAVVLEAENTVTTGSDATGHAETNLVRLATKSFDLAALRTSTLYTSCEPCAMCTGAIYWAGIGRIVYALAEHELLPLTGDHPDNPTLDLPCREVLARGQRAVAVDGPALEAEARLPHLGFWH